MTLSRESFREIGRLAIEAFKWDAVRRDGDPDSDLRAVSGMDADAEVDADTDTEADAQVADGDPDLADEAELEPDIAASDAVGDADPDVDGDELLFADLTRPPEPTLPDSPNSEA